jgi:hypothetical protein
MKMFLSGLAVAFILGCASLATPTTINQRIVYVEAGLTAASDTTADLLSRDRINVKIAQDVYEGIESGHTLVSNAKLAVGVKDMKTAGDFVTQAQKVLLVVEAKLKEQQNNTENALKAVSTLLDLTSFMSFLATRISEASALIQRAQAEGRDVTDEELATMDTALTKSQLSLKELIKQKS